MKERGGDRLKCAINESTLSTADAVPLPQWGRLRYENAAIPEAQPSPREKAKRRRLRRKKGSQPRLAALGSPFQGKGLAWTLPPSLGRRCPEGAEVGFRYRLKRNVRYAFSPFRPSERSRGMTMQEIPIRFLQAKSPFPGEEWAKKDRPKISEHGR